ncbi:hypothetical protein WICPIJ_009409 [Wickerhamomyces pijperi]|uniref:Uncharacterized protein n=1 Tax=Wickerhamomyces pijperi TaxID=599730 RepID=A0A9P8PP52_WICPI|nr:hypothetical protein WICPIJ_009409 [Wickerhamomyces pijperi]
MLLLLMSCKIKALFKINSSEVKESALLITGMTLTLVDNSFMIWMSNSLNPLLVGLMNIELGFQIFNNSIGNKAVVNVVTKPRS